MDDDWKERYEELLEDLEGCRRDSLLYDLELVALGAVLLFGVEVVLFLYFFT